MEGFHNGAAYITAKGNSGEITIDTEDSWTDFDLSLTSTHYLNAEIDSDKIQVNLGGYYLINYNVTTSGASNDDGILGIYIGRVASSGVLNYGQQQFMSKQGDNFTHNGTAITDLQGKETIHLVIQNTSAAANITIESFEIVAIRIGDLASQNLNYLAGNSFGGAYHTGTNSMGFAAVDTFYKIDQTLTTTQAQQIKVSNNQFYILQDGFYLVVLSLTTSGSANDDMTIGLMKNGSDQTDVLSYPQQRYNSKGGDFWQTGLSGIVEMKEGDTLAMCLANNTDTSGNTQLNNINYNIIRLGNL